MDIERLIVEFARDILRITGRWPSVDDEYDPPNIDDVMPDVEPGDWVYRFNEDDSEIESLMVCNVVDGIPYLVPNCANPARRPPRLEIAWREHYYKTRQAAIIGDLELITSDYEYHRKYLAKTQSLITEIGRSDGGNTDLQ